MKKYKEASKEQHQLSHMGQGIAAKSHTPKENKQAQKKSKGTQGM